MREPVLRSKGGQEKASVGVVFSSRTLKGLEEMLPSGGESELQVVRWPSSKESPSEAEPDGFVSDPNTVVS